MTPVKKTKEKAEAEEQGETKDEPEKKKEFEGQLTQLEATFTLDKVKILFALGEGSLDSRTYINSTFFYTKLKLRKIFRLLKCNSRELPSLKHQEGLENRGKDQLRS